MSSDFGLFLTNTTMNLKELGSFGENIACFYLKNKGYKILDRNYCKEWSAVSKGEIDIVAKKEETISFVEVKTQTSPAFGGAGFSPEDKINFQKQRKLIKLAEIWFLEKKIPQDTRWQIDVITIKIDFNLQKAKIRHFKNAIC